MASFKRFGVAAAVAAALGASGVAQALTLAQPGDALLIPYVVAGQLGKSKTVTNTLIGVIVADPRTVNTEQFKDLSQDPTLWPHLPAAGTLSPLATKVYDGSNPIFPAGTPRCSKNVAGSNGANLHWYWFNKDSIHMADDTISVSCEDFARFDWNYVLGKKFSTLVDQPGYMVITDDAAKAGGASGLVLYGAAYQIRGNWASQAFIPVVPMVDSKDGTLGDEVTHGGSQILNVNPVTAGMLLPSPTSALAAVDPNLSSFGTGATARFSMRYFLDSALNGATTFVVWFPDTGYSTRAAVPVLVYDADEDPSSASVALPHELNLVQVESGVSTPTAPYTAVLSSNLDHENTDGAGVTAVGNAVDTGFVFFELSDFRAVAKDVVVDGNSVSEPASSITNGIYDGGIYYSDSVGALVSCAGTDPTGTAQYGECSRAGVAFSLIGIGGGAVADQVQTELAHERGVK